MTGPLFLFNKLACNTVNHQRNKNQRNSTNFSLFSLPGQIRRIKEGQEGRGRRWRFRWGRGSGGNHRGRQWNRERRVRHPLRWWGGWHWMWWWVHGSTSLFHINLIPGFSLSLTRADDDDDNDDGSGSDDQA